MVNESAKNFCNDIADMSKFNVNHDGATVDKLTVRKCLMTVVNKKLEEKDIKGCSKDMLKSSLKSIECVSKSKSKPIIFKDNIREDCTFVLGGSVQCPEGKYIFEGDKLSNKINDTTRASAKPKEDAGSMTNHSTNSNSISK